MFCDLKFQLDQQGNGLPSNTNGEHVNEGTTICQPRCESKGIKHRNFNRINCLF
jgi:hypothetical protein